MSVKRKVTVPVGTSLARGSGAAAASAGSCARIAFSRRLQLLSGLEAQLVAEQPLPLPVGLERLRLAP